YRPTSTVIRISRKTGKITRKLGPPRVAGQHAPTLLENGNVLIFDNGPHRLDDSVPYSRVIEPENPNCTERKKGRAENSVIHNPGSACAKERQGGEQSKVALCRNDSYCSAQRGRPPLIEARRDGRGREPDANAVHQGRTYGIQNRAHRMSKTQSQSARRLNRHSPDDSEISVESSDFAASLEARREMWLATSSSGSPNDGRGSDLAIFPGIWTHSFYRCS